MAPAKKVPAKRTKQPAVAIAKTAAAKRNAAPAKTRQPNKRTKTVDSYVEYDGDDGNVSPSSVGSTFVVVSLATDKETEEKNDKSESEDSDDEIKSEVEDKPQPKKKAEQKKAQARPKKRESINFEDSEDKDEVEEQPTPAPKGRPHRVKNNTPVEVDEESESDFEDPESPSPKPKKQTRKTPVSVTATRDSPVKARAAAKRRSSAFIDASDSESTPESTQTEDKNTEEPLAGHNKVIIDNEHFASSQDLNELNETSTFNKNILKDSSKGNHQSTAPESENENSNDEMADSFSNAADGKVTASTSNPNKSTKSSREVPPTAPASNGDAAAEASDAESEMSIVLDELPASRKRGSSKQSSSSLPAKKKAKRTSTRPSSTTSAAKKEITPEEAELKDLQAKIKKCGVNKVWHFEFKRLEITSHNEKIRHLKKALKDLLGGERWSEKRAEEIKEQRELAEDLEAVKKGDVDWGMESDKRATRGALKSGKGDDEMSEGEKEKKAAKARAELSFLGDDDEESD